MLIRTAAPKVHTGQFKKGDDHRRHTLTHEEKRRGGVNGFAAAWKSLETRFPGCDPHFLLCAIMGSKRWDTLPEIQYLIQRDEPLRADAALALFMRD